MSNSLFGRKYKISVVGNKPEEAWNVSNLRCVFRIEKSAIELINISLVDIYNLNTNTRNSIIKEGSRIIVEAGYDGFENTKDAKGAPTKTPLQYGKIYDGNIVQVIRNRENNVDYKLTIVSLDGENILSQNWISHSLAPRSTPQSTVEAITANSKFKIPVGRISDNLDKSELPRGKVLFGQPRDYLRDISYNNNGTFYVEDGSLYLTKATDIPVGEVLELSPKTGLIGYPTQTDAGVTFKCLLNPRIVCKCMVKLNKDDIIPLQASHRGQMFVPADSEGEYQVEKLVHTGDTRGQEWYTTVVGVGRLGKTFYPMLMENSKQNPMGGGG